METSERGKSEKYPYSFWHKSLGICHCLLGRFLGSRVQVGCSAKK